MAKAQKVLTKCLGPIGHYNDILVGVDALDGVDHWDSYLKTVADRLTETEMAAFKRDSNRLSWMSDTGVWGEYKNVPRGWSILLDDLGFPVKNSKGEYVYFDYASRQVADPALIKPAKDKFLWFFEKNKKRMVAAPIWYHKVKKIISEYPDYAEAGGLTSPAGADNFRHHIYEFFSKVESGEADRNWDKILYTAFFDGRGTHWYLMSQMIPHFFDVLENKESIEQYLGMELQPEQVSDFREAVSALASKSRVSGDTIIEVLGPEYKKYYLRPAPLLYTFVDGKPKKLDKPIVGNLTKNYLLGLSVSQQVEQMKAILGADIPISKFKAWVKLKLWNHLGGSIFKFVNIIGNPSNLAALMSISGGLPGFASLLALNSGMIVGEFLSGKTLPGNWSALKNAHGLGRGLPVIEDAIKPEIGLGSLARGYTANLMELYRQGLFNASEPLMVGYYQQMQMARFFREMFPGVKSWDEVNELLTRLKITDSERYVKTIEAAHKYTDHVMGRMFNHHARSGTNNDAPITYGLSRPYVETLVSMRHFFSSWGLNKMRNMIDMLSWEAKGYVGTKVGAMHLDLMSYNPDKVGHLLNLRQQELDFFLNKLVWTFKIGKYLDRVGEDENQKKEETIFDDVADMFSFASVFNGDIASLDSTPYGRIVKHFLTMVSLSTQIDLEGEDGIDVGGAAIAGTAAATLEAFRSFFRKLYIPQMLTEVYSGIEDGQLEDKDFLSLIGEAVKNGSAGFLHYLDREFEAGGYRKNIQIGPGSVISRMLGMSDPSKAFISDLMKVTKLRYMFENELVFETTLMYGLPFAKQYFGAKHKDYKDFYEAIDAYNSSEAGKSIVDGKIPVDAYDSDYLHLYNSLTPVLPIKRGKVDSSFYFDSSFEVDGKTVTPWSKQSLIDTIHGLKELGVEKTDATELINTIENMNVTENKKDALVRAQYVMDYIEKGAPGASLVALAYVMNKKVFEEVYLSGEKYDKEKDAQLIARKMEEAKIKVMKEYGDLGIQVDRKYSLPQFYLHYAKSHDLGIAKYINDPNEYHTNTLRIITPEGFGSKELKHSMQAFLYTAAAAHEGIENPDILLSEYSKIFDVNKYRQADGSLPPNIASYFLNLFSITTKYIDTLAIPEKEKRTLKMSTLTLGDEMFNYIIKDEKLMEKEDIKEVIKDWSNIYFEEFKEIDKLAEEKAEEEIEEKKYSKGYKKYKKEYFKYPKGLYQWRDYMKKRYYKNYVNWRPAHWSAKSSYPVDYLKESEYLRAKRTIELRGIHSLADAKSKSKSSGFFGKQKDGIMAMGRRGKSIANYVREDIDKPVEYRLPWRKRWVRKGKGLDPISTITWKHLTPKPRKK